MRCAYPGYAGFDVATIAFAIVAVRHQPEVTAIPAIQHRIDRLAGNGDLRFAADLAPHRAGGIQHQHGRGVLRVRCVQASRRECCDGQ